jgi:hypothetical protein
MASKQMSSLLPKQPGSPKSRSFLSRDIPLSGRMAGKSIPEAVEVSEQEHTVGELSNANLQSAKSSLESSGMVAWRCLWPRNKEIERETLDVLGSLPTEKNFIHVNTRSLLPRHIIYNRVSGPLRKNMVLPTH